MLLNLHVKNLAIIDEIEVDFAEGLDVLTGETGAGKSIIIGSINMAIGGKVPKDIIRKGADFALAELLFSVDTDEQKRYLEEHGITAEDNEVLISRKFTKGRGINRINGESVPVSVLKQAAAVLIDVHGQNEQQSLLYKREHMEIVDRYAREKMALIAKQHQVICISHLAQIAAMADAHYLIEKTSGGAHTSTQIRMLSGSEEVQELARILGGAQITEAVINSAEEMKELALNLKKSL